MIFRSLAAPICFFAFVSFASNATAEKLRLLEELTTSNGLKYFFRPERISAVFPNGFHKALIQGISLVPVPVEEDGRAFLIKHQLDSKFVELTSKAGKIYLRATFIDFITPVVMPSPDQLKRTPGAECIAHPHIPNIPN